MGNISPSDFRVANYLFDKLYIERIEDDYHVKNSYPIVYILYDLKRSIAYVGESTSALSRMLSHLSHPEKKRLKYVYIISSQNFNKSAALDIESNLIKYMVADGMFVLLNGNAGIADHNYYQKNQYHKVFENIWENLKLQRVVTKNILDIDNSDLFKYSPYKALTLDQHNAVRLYLKILLNKDNSTVFVEGSAGTGKTILAVYLIKLLLTKFDIEDYEDLEGESLQELQLVQEIQNQKENLSIGLVVPMVSLRKTIKEVFKNVKGLKSSMVLGPSDVLKKDYDVLIVDEAHRLKRRFGITNYRSHDANNKALGLGNEGTELDWILKSSKHQLLFYDQAQSIRPSDIHKDVFLSIKKLNETEKIKLTSQLRSKGGVDYMDFIDDLLNTKLSKGDKKFESKNYDLKIFRSLPMMIGHLEQREEKFGLCRMMAGYSWKWVSKNSNKPDAIIDGISLTWNRVAHDWINSTTDLTEIGCIHTTQGYDLNYAGIIFGNEIKFNKETQEIEIDKSQYFDSKGMVGVKDIEILKDFIINIYKTLMYRGIKGTYIYVCDNNLREYFEDYIYFED
ncbi:DUF2075 domain-containing protein [Maribacter sp. 1_2014MBL_MicDiv]|uniref:DUF2075 domain-containing protein n=1 Tax=Maribacter sp. 1_2014MBL_MicDiv TaxID=1644130 RepID=UPI0008F4A61D|nr:DUF2075 domain-containing protein [Maribacter sp. 1_2014MBL_MicDiv]APA65655.1 hypothetical protein YQ22_15835 [Maribacter sp. 1_2014MBL_MicDiv]